jgi:hypothetical protein
MKTKLECFWEQVQTTLKTHYLGKASNGKGQELSTGLPTFWRPFAVIWKSYKGAKMSGKKYTVADAGQFLAKRALVGPVINICFLGIPFFIMVGKQAKKNFEAQQAGTGGGGAVRQSRFARQPQAQQEEPVVLEVPENDVGVELMQTESVKTTLDKRAMLGRTAKLPMKQFADEYMRRVFHGLYMAGMREDIAYRFANGEFEGQDMAELAESGIWNDGDVAAFTCWFKTLHPK